MSGVDLMALCRVKGADWHFLAREAQRPAGLANLLSGRATEQSPDATETLAVIDTDRDQLNQHRKWVTRVVDAARADGVGLTTILDDDYPINLRTIFNPPPFLFYRGTLDAAQDAMSVGVVGTREPTDRGRAETRELAAALAAEGVTVLSGLARGIDTEAHEATLAAGGRTVAVMGTGIRRIYPPENRMLAERIAAGNGALVSQFWPDAPPTSYSFPRRNVVTSGMGQGTVVVEASSTSGAKMQARFALEHGKLVFLPTRLVHEREWARRYIGRGAIVVESATDIVALLLSPEAIRARSNERLQLALALD